MKRREFLRVLSGAANLLLPMASVKDIPTIPGELLAKFQTGFYADATDAIFKALGVGVTPSQDRHTTACVQVVHTGPAQRSRRQARWRNSHRDGREIPKYIYRCADICYDRGHAELIPIGFSPYLTQPSAVGFFPFEAALIVHAQRPIRFRCCSFHSTERRQLSVTDPVNVAGNSLLEINFALWRPPSA
jgi:hypothetical protein